MTVEYKEFPGNFNGSISWKNASESWENSTDPSVNTLSYEEDNSKLNSTENLKEIQTKEDEIIDNPQNNAYTGLSSRYLERSGSFISDPILSLVLFIVVFILVFIWCCWQCSTGDPAVETVFHKQYT